MWTEVEQSVVWNIYIWTVEYHRTTESICRYDSRSSYIHYSLSLSLCRNADDVDKYINTLSKTLDYLKPFTITFWKPDTTTNELLSKHAEPIYISSSTRMRLLRIEDRNWCIHNMMFKNNPIEYTMCLAHHLVPRLDYYYERSSRLRWWSYV